MDIWQISLPRRLLAARTARHHVGHRRGRHRPVGYQGEASPACQPLPIGLERRIARRRAMVLIVGLCQRHHHRRNARRCAQLPGARLQGDPPAIGRAGPCLDLWRGEGQQALRAGRWRVAVRTSVVDGEISALGARSAFGRGSRWRLELGRPSTARCASPPDTDRWPAGWAGISNPIGCIAWLE